MQPSSVENLPKQKILFTAIPYIFKIKHRGKYSAKDKKVDDP
jgi:hypothetical protein